MVYAKMKQSRKQGGGKRGPGRPRKGPSEEGPTLDNVLDLLKNREAEPRGGAGGRPSGGSGDKRKAAAKAALANKKSKGDEGGERERRGPAYTTADRAAGWLRIFFEFETDLPVHRRNVHPSGMLHTRSSRWPAASEPKGDEQAFAWIENSLHVDAALRALERRGFDVTGGATFLPYSTRENWSRKYPHARVTLVCSAEGECSFNVPNASPEAKGHGVENASAHHCNQLGRTTPAMSDHQSDETDSSLSVDEDQGSEIDRLRKELAAKDLVIARQKNESEGIRAIVASGNGRKSFNAVMGSIDRKKDPMWTRAVELVESEVVVRTMLLKDGSHLYSQEGNTFCQRCLDWTGYKDAEGNAVDEERLWSVLVYYIYEALGNARTSVRLRCLYQWKRDRKMGTRLDHNKLEKFERLVWEGCPDAFYQDGDMMVFFLDLIHTYGMCGIRDKGKGDIRRSLDEGTGSVFDYVKPAQMAFATLSLLNNYKLWSLRDENAHDGSHRVHKIKGGRWTAKNASGGGGCTTFQCGWDDEGLAMHKALLSFYFKIKKHDRFADLVKLCGVWWAKNKAKIPGNRKQATEDSHPEKLAPTFDEFSD